MVEPFLASGTALLVPGVVLAIVSVASDEWTCQSGGFNSGLWRECLPSGSCSSIDVVPDSLEAVRAMMILTVIAAGIALVMAVAELIYTAIQKYITYWVIRIACMLCLLAALLCLIGIIVYHSEIKEDEEASGTDYGYSFWVGVAAIILFFLAGILFLVSAYRLKNIRKRRREQMEPNRMFGRVNDHRNPYAYSEQSYHRNDLMRTPEFYRRPYGDAMSSESNYRRYGEARSSEYTNKRSKETKSSALTNGGDYYGKSSALSPFQDNYKYYVTSPAPFRIYNHGMEGISNPASRSAEYYSSRSQPGAYRPGYKMNAKREQFVDQGNNFNVSRTQQSSYFTSDYIGAATNPTALKASAKPVEAGNFGQTTDNLGRADAGLWGISTKGEQIIDEKGNIVFSGSRRGNEHIGVATAVAALGASTRGVEPENLGASGRGLVGGNLGASGRGLVPGNLGSSGRGLVPGNLAASSRSLGVENLGASARSLGLNDLGQTMNTMAPPPAHSQGSQYGYNVSLGNSKRDPYGYPLNYQRDL